MNPSNNEPFWIIGKGRMETLFSNSYSSFALLAFGCCVLRGLTCVPTSRITFLENSGWASQLYFCSGFCSESQFIQQNKLVKLCSSSPVKHLPHYQKCRSLQSLQAPPAPTRELELRIPYDRKQAIIKNPYFAQRIPLFNVCKCLCLLVSDFIFGSSLAR